MNQFSKVVTIFAQSSQCEAKVIITHAKNLIPIFTLVRHLPPYVYWTLVIPHLYIRSLMLLFPLYNLIIFCFPRTNTQTNCFNFFHTTHLLHIVLHDLVKKDKANHHKKRENITESDFEKGLAKGNLYVHLSTFPWFSLKKKKTGGHPTTHFLFWWKKAAVVIRFNLKKWWIVT